MRIANIATGAVVVVIADAGGGFSALVPRGSTDTLVVSVLDAATNESPAVSISPTSAEQTTIEIATPVQGWSHPDRSTVVTAAILRDEIKQTTARLSSSSAR